MFAQRVCKINKIDATGEMLQILFQKSRQILPEFLYRGSIKTTPFPP